MSLSGEISRKGIPECLVRSPNVPNWEFAYLRERKRSRGRRRECRRAVCVGGRENKRMKGRKGRSLSEGASPSMLCDIPRCSRKGGVARGVRSETKKKSGVQGAEGGARQGNRGPG